MGKERKKKNKRAKRINENKGVANNIAKASSSPVVGAHKGLAIKPVHIILVIVIVLVKLIVTMLAKQSIMLRKRTSVKNLKVNLNEVRR